MNYFAVDGFDNKSFSRLSRVAHAKEVLHLSDLVKYNGQHID